MKIEHPEYIQRFYSKKKNNSLCYHIGIAMLFCIAFLVAISISSRADENINIIYPENYVKDITTNIETENVANGVVSNTTNTGTETSTTSGFIYSSDVPLSADVQEYIWNKCKASASDYRNYYYFMLGAIQLESSFKSKAIHYNKNGTVDRGLCQINSCNIKKMKKLGLIGSSDDLFNVYKNIDCGFAMMNKYINMFGVSESAYYAYNTGREKHGSNSNSRLVMKYMSQWKGKLS